MRAYVAAFVMAAFVAVVLTPLVRRMALRMGVVDLPGGRRVHQTSTPRLGGIAIFFAVMLPLTALFFVESSVATAVQNNQLRVMAMLVGGLFMAAMGAYDDLRGIRALYKLYGQIAVGALAFSCGLRIDSIFLPFVGSLEMGIFALPITIFWVVGVINAVNLIDGLDGLAAGIVFFAALTNFIVAYVTGSIVVGAIMATTLGALLGFLLFNFNPARIFMGDSGSYFLGYLLATAALMGASQKASTSVALLAPVIALGVPIFDTLFAVVRRFLERRPLFAPDRGHLHHRLLDMGITHRRAVLILYGVSILFTAAAIGISLGRNWEVGIAILVATVVVIGLVRFVGVLHSSHHRNRLKRRILERDVDRLRRRLPETLRVLQEASGADDAWERLTGLAPSLGVAGLELLEVQGRQEKSLVLWQRPDFPRASVISARFPFADKRLNQRVLKFTWPSDDHGVSPQADILLQLLADAVEAAWIRELGPVQQPAAMESGNVPSLARVSTVSTVPTLPSGTSE
jgi:UDP-GlcNAc:undecaprenyl-phosphate GlcNAc-1-phosphate transferase